MCFTSESRICNTAQLSYLFLRKLDVIVWKLQRLQLKRKILFLIFLLRTWHKCWCCEVSWQYKVISTITSSVKTTSRKGIKRSRNHWTSPSPSIIPSFDLFAVRYYLVLSSKLYFHHHRSLFATHWTLLYLCTCPWGNFLNVLPRLDDERTSLINTTESNTRQNNNVYIEKQGIGMLSHHCESDLWKTCCRTYCWI